MSNYNIHKGKNIVLYSSFWGDIAMCDSCSVSFNQELIETAATTNGARQYVKGKRDATVSSSGLLLINDGLIDTSITGMYNEITDNEDDVFLIRFEFTQTGQYIQCPCLISSLEYNGESTGYGTWSASFQVTGDTQLI